MVDVWLDDLAVLHLDSQSRAGRRASYEQRGISWLRLGIVLRRAVLILRSLCPQPSYRPSISKRECRTASREPLHLIVMSGMVVTVFISTGISDLPASGTLTTVTVVTDVIAFGRVVSTYDGNTRTSSSVCL